MRRRLAALASAALSGCVSGVPDNARTHEYDGVSDVAGYWVREWEHSEVTIWRFAADQDDPNFREAPPAFKECAGQEAARLSPPDLVAAAERFVGSKRWDDFRTVLLMQRAFVEDYEDRHGATFGSRIEELCKDELGT